eukprot:2543536-Amphidinium_carterae.1
MKLTVLGKENVAQLVRVSIHVIIETDGVDCTHFQGRRLIIGEEADPALRLVPRSEMDMPEPPHVDVVGVTDLPVGRNSVSVLAKVNRIAKKALMCTDPYAVQKFISVSEDVDASQTFIVLCIHYIKKQASFINEKESVDRQKQKVTDDDREISSV